MLRRLIVAFALVVSAPALAQTESKLDSPEPFFLYKPTIPDVAEGGGNLEFEIMVSPALEIHGIEVLAGRPLCDCLTIGQPPRRICLIGCPGGGGGGGGVLLENPLIVEFLTKMPDDAGGVPSLEVTAVPFGSDRLEAAEFRFDLEGMPEM